MARVLTLDNMHDVKLQRLFDDHALNRWQSVIARLARKITKQKTHITLADVYNQFSQGKQFHEVQEALQLSNHSPIDAMPILNKTILIGESFYHAVNPGIRGFKKANIIRALCDENIDEHHAAHGALKVFGQASHTTFEGLTNEPDSLVWKTALAFDIIISKDRATKAGRVTPEERDLTNCAYDAWKEVLEKNGGIIDQEIRSLPILIHITDARVSGREIRNMLKKYKTEILNLVKDCKSPVIELTKNGAKAGTYYLELFEGGSAQLKKDMVNKRFWQFMGQNPLNLTREEKLRERRVIFNFVKASIDDKFSIYRDSESLIRQLKKELNRTDVPYSAMSLKRMVKLGQSVKVSRDCKKTLKLSIVA